MITAKNTALEGLRVAAMLDEPVILKVSIKGKVGLALFVVGPDALLVEKILTEMKKDVQSGEGAEKGTSNAKGKKSGK